jgi:hypothetical protein
MDVSPPPLGKTGFYGWLGRLFGTDNDSVVATSRVLQEVSVECPRDNIMICVTVT